MHSHADTANRIAWRLCKTFFGENVADSGHIKHLARFLLKCNFDLKKAVETILRSKLFFSDNNLKTQIASPTDFAISTIRALELFSPPPSTVKLAWQIDEMGQRLFEPPNVFGWKGGRSWINTRSLLSRRRFAQVASTGKLHREKKHHCAKTMASNHKITDAHQASFFEQLLLGYSVAKHKSNQHSIENLQTWVVERLASADAQLQ